MSPFGLWGGALRAGCVGAAKPETEKKGLEIIIGNPQITVRYNGDRIGGIYKNNNGWEFLSENSYANSDTLRKIAAKLDELNGENHEIK